MTKTGKRIIFGLFLLFTVAALYFASGLVFSEDLSSFFPDKDEDLEFYESFSEKFPEGNESLLLGLKSTHGVFEGTFLPQIEQLTKACESLPEIQNCRSLANIQSPQIDLFSVTWKPLVKIDEPASYAKAQEKILADERLVNTLIDSSGSSIVLLLTLKESLPTGKFIPLLSSLKDMVVAHGFEEYHFLGKNYLQAELVQHQQKDMQRISIMAVLLIFIILILIFKRFWGILIALSTVLVGLILFAGYLGLAGFDLDSLSPLYPILMIIVGTSDIIHILTKYTEEMSEGKSRNEAIRITIREIGKATLLTSLTTAIGFLSLLTSNIIAIREFGLNAAVGVMIAYLTSILLGTILASWLNGSQIIKPSKSNSQLNLFLGWFFRITKTRGRAVLAGLTLVFLFSIWGTSKVNVDYKLRDTLPRGTAIADDLNFFEQNFGGYRSFQMAISAQNDYLVNDFELVKEIEKLDQHLKTYESISGVNSLNTVYKSLNRASRNDLARHYKLPKSKSRFDELDALAQIGLDSALSASMSSDQKFGLLNAQIKDIGSSEIKKINDQIDLWIHEEIDSSIVTFRHTGHALILDKNARYIRSSLLYGLGIAIVIVSLLMVLLFRSFSLLLISLVPNIFPLLMTAAMLGIAGIDLNANVTILFTVVFGIAVDDTIHFLSRIKLALAEGMSLDEAIRITFKETGKAIVQTSIILFFGFFVLVFSSMPHTITMGLLMALTLASALFFDFLIIPVLLRIFIRQSK